MQRPGPHRKNPAGPNDNSRRLGFARASALVLGLLIGDGPGPAASAAEVTDGEALFKHCKTCHAIGEGARNKVGPHLNDIIGRPAASVQGFTYSKAMVAKGQDGLAWTVDNLDAYLAKPRAFIPGNRMSFRGMDNAKDRATLIAWLRAAHGSVGSGATEPPPPDGQPHEMADLILATKGDVAYGEYLSSECVTCHQASGHADGIPSIVGLPRAHFVRALLEYKNNIRTNEVMKLITSPLGNEEIAALADYFGGLAPK